MKKIALLAVGALAMLPVVSCEDSSSAGASLVQDEVEIVMDSAFTVSGRPVSNDLVQSRTILQLLGSIKAGGYGTFSSDIVCQYMPAANIDTFGVKADYIDSVKLELCMYQSAFAGDSTVPMGLKVYMLNKQLPSPIYSDFDPSGYYDASSPLGGATYSALLDGAEIATDANGVLYKSIYVDLPREIGLKLYDLFLNSPQTLQSPQAFAKWFPGLYIANSFGSGRVTRINSNRINVYYHSVHKITDETNPRDTTLYHVSSYMGVTPEVISNNNISYTMSDDLKTMAQDGETILVGPTGYDVEFTFPAQDILDKYYSQSGSLAVINALNFSIPVKTIDNDYGLLPPPYILMVKKSQKDKFFATTQINDNLSSFYATYDSSTQSYSFSSMRDYIIDLVKKGEVTSDDVEFVICPVQVSFYSNASSSSLYGYYYGYYGYNTTSMQVSTITPYVTEPVMTILDLDNAKIDFTFSKQTLGGK